MVGISIVQQKQVIPTFTFCKMIKEEFPDTHITIGGNIVTRLRDVIKENEELFQYYDSAVIYEGESLSTIGGFAGQGRERFLHPAEPDL